MHLLELFSGTGSVGKVFRDAGWSVTAVDLDPRAVADIHCDVLDLTPELVETYGRPDVLWASPPCTEYSRARTTAKKPRDLVQSDRLVKKALDLAAHWGIPFFIENPASGLMKTRAVLRDVPCHIVSYCKYKDHRWRQNYRKDTAIWTDTDWAPSMPRCRRDCACMDESGRRHRQAAQQFTPGRMIRQFTVQELHQIPPKLCEDVMGWCNVSIF